MPSCQFLVAATCSIPHLGHSLLLFFFSPLFRDCVANVWALHSRLVRHQHPPQRTTTARPTTPPLLPLPSSSASSRPTSCLRLHLVYHHRRCIPHHPGPVSHTNRATPN